MAFKTRLRGIFGWSSNRRPMSKPTLKDMALQSQQVQSAADRYHSELDFLHRKRQDKYDVYDAMDNMADVSSVLDAYAEDAVQLDQEHKKSVWITAKKLKTKKLLNSFLHETLNVEDFIEGLCRDVAKIGDDFANIKAKRGKGVTSLVWRDPRDIERIENQDGILIGFEETTLLGSYKQRVNSERQQGRDGSSVKPTYEPWDIIHFRIFKKKRLPKEKRPNIYGTSVLDGSERVAKQVKILDDLLMIMRLTRSLDRYTYYVDVGRSPVEEEVNILRRWKRALKRKTYFDPATGQFDSRFDPYAWSEDIFWSVKENRNSRVEVQQGITNISDIVDIDHFRDKFFGSLRAPKAYFGYEGDVNCLSGDTKIPLLDGTEATIESLVGQTVWVYSCTQDGKVEPGVAYDIRKSGEVKDILEIELDNGEVIRATSEHRFMYRDGSFVFARDLKTGDSLMPLYRQSDWFGYEEVYVPGKASYEKTHQVVAKYFEGDDLYEKRLDPSCGNVIHHKDLNKLNNEPDNLQVMSYDDHLALHSKIGVSEEPSKKSKRASELMTRLNKDPEFKKRRVEALRKAMQTDSYKKNCGLTKWNRNRPQESYDRAAEKLVERWKDNNGRLRKEVLPKFEEARDKAREVRKIKLDSLVHNGLIESEGSVTNFAKNVGISVEHARKRMSNRNLHVATNRESGEVFCVEYVLGEYNKDGVFAKNHKIKSIKKTAFQDPIPVYDLSVAGENETFALSAGIFVHNSKASLSSQSLKWSKAVTSIQRAVKRGLTRLCQIHLAYLGLDTSSDQFEVHMTLPSIVELLDKLEAWQNVVDVAERMSTLGETLSLDKYDWTVYILENVMWLSDDEVKKFAKKIPKDEPQDQGDDDKPQKEMPPPQPFDTPFTQPDGEPQPADTAGEPKEPAQQQPEESRGTNGKRGVQYASAEVDRLLLEIKDHMESRIN